LLCHFLRSFRVGCILLGLSAVCRRSQCPVSETCLLTYHEDGNRQSPKRWILTHPPRQIVREHFVSGFLHHPNDSLPYAPLLRPFLCVMLYNLSLYAVLVYCCSTSEEKCLIT
jgi:hypothetical protein